MLIRDLKRGPCGISDAIDAYSTFCDLERGNTGKWIEWKSLTLREFRRFVLDQNARGMDLWECHHLSAFLANRRDAGDSPATINRRAVIVRGFARWCERQGRVKSIPLARATIKTPAEEQRDLPPWLVMLALAKRLNPDHAQAALALAYTGCRRNELLGTLWSEIDWTRGLLRLPGSRTKNKKARAVPLPEEAIEILKARRAKDPKGRGPFLDEKGVYTVKPESLTHAWRREADAAGHRAVRLHDLRHAYCTRSLTELGADIVTVQMVAGHSSIQTTRKYLHANSDAAERMKAAWDAAAKPKA